MVYGVWCIVQRLWSVGYGLGCMLNKWCMMYSGNAFAAMCMVQYMCICISFVFPLSRLFTLWLHTSCCRFGVPRAESKLASTAGAGSLLLEFQVCTSVYHMLHIIAHIITHLNTLHNISHIITHTHHNSSPSPSPPLPGQLLSYLTGEAKFGEAAFSALQALAAHRSPLNLTGMLVYSAAHAEDYRSPTEHVILIILLHEPAHSTARK
ncbi:hypothetical protein EON63_21485 [archaeon]|nr:MAG: hypothetical protein EON63_21485 [archaeon]